MERYKHRIFAQIVKENTDDIAFCTYCAKLKWEREYSEKNVYHTKNYKHFKNEFKDKVRCK